MGQRLKDRVALVTGAGSSGPGWGNGKATAVLHAADLTEEYVEFNKGDISDPATLGG